MPLHPQAEMLLDQLNGTGAPPLNEMPLDQARQFGGAMAALAGPAQTIKTVEDREIAAPGRTIPVRIYRPSDETALPIVVNFHGGGWILGDIELDDAACRELSIAVGAVFISVGYRLAPEHPFPEPLDDGYAVLTWAHEHAADIGGDPDRIAVMGESAGGNLAAALALRARDEGGPVLRLQLLLYPVLDSSMSTRSYTDNAEGYFLTRDLMEWAWGHYAGTSDRTNPYLSPMHAPDLTGLAPALVLTAEYDPLRDEGHAYTARLQAAEVEASATCYPGMFHGFALMGAVLDDAAAAMDECARALRSAFLVGQAAAR